MSESKYKSIEFQGIAEAIDHLDAACERLRESVKRANKMIDRVLEEHPIQVVQLPPREVEPLHAVERRLLDLVLQFDWTSVEPDPRSLVTDGRAALQDWISFAQKRAALAGVARYGDGSDCRSEAPSGPPSSTLGTSTIMPELEVERISRAAFDKLLDYSATLPTGTTIGFRWRRQLADRSWLTGEYVKSDQPGHVGIKWRRAVINEAVPS